MAFGISHASGGLIERLELVDVGLLPQAGGITIPLEISGSFPAGARAEVACEIADVRAGSPAECFACKVQPTSVALQDPFSINIEPSASPLCPALHEAKGHATVSATLWVRPTPDSDGKPSEMAAWQLPITAKLEYAVVEVQRVSVTAGAEAEVSVTVPVPVRGGGAIAMDFTIEPAAELPEGLVIEPQTDHRIHDVVTGDTTEVTLRVRSPDCCEAGDYQLVLIARDGESGLRIPVTLTVEKPSFWTCPGKQIAMGLAGLAALGLLIWLVRGFTSPAKFADAAVLVRGESHEALAKVVDGDEDWRLVRSLETTKRGFYKPATIHFGGSQAALPSLRGMSDDAKIEARPHGNATLVVSAEGIEQFKESTGWQLVPVGQHPLGSSIVLRRDGTYVQFRR
jgi:hypothetical protein